MTRRFRVHRVRRKMAKRYTIAYRCIQAAPSRIGGPSCPRDRRTFRLSWTLLGAGSLIACLFRRRVVYSWCRGFPNSLESASLHLVGPEYDSDGEVRDGAWVAEITGLLNLDSWPKDMRFIGRKERSHPGAQLRITDAAGLRATAFERAQLSRRTHRPQ